MIRIENKVPADANSVCRHCFAKISGAIVRERSP